MENRGYGIPTRLDETSYIGVMGDWHGNFRHVPIVLKMFYDKGIHVLMQLGDFGMIWPDEDWHENLDRLSTMLTDRLQTLYVVDGNHEFFPALLAFPVSDDGLRWLRPNIAHMPRGYRTRICHGTMTLAAMGGANSHDRFWRKEGESWWPEEEITEADLAALGIEHADVLVGHESPGTTRTRAETGNDDIEMAYVAESQEMFIRAIIQVRPQLILGGHYHRYLDKVATFADPHPFSSRVVVLDRDLATGISQAVLEVYTLRLKYFYRDGREVRAFPAWTS